MKLTLKRVALKDTYTIGKLYINGTYFCDTLEDKYRDLTKEKKIPGETCIPYGKYKVIINESPRFKRLLPRLLDVPHFDGILIHRGNTDKDTAGCILVGENRQIGKVINSTGYETKLVDILLSTSEPITIEIV